jgi:protoporphyrinogen oxidase
MHIAIIGGGVTGLAAAYTLTKRGVKVTVFEKDQTLGGLASGFRTPSWDWPLEKTYHHFFTNDKAIITLAKELGMEQNLMILSPTTSVYWNNKQYPFDTPITILKFPGIPFLDRLRTGITAAVMKINPFWQPLEHMTAKQVFLPLNGNAAWKTIWEPLLDAKFGPYAGDIAASWLWGRLYKRTPRLGYFRGGFSRFVDVLALAIQNQGGVIKTNTAVTDIDRKKFDAILLTVPSRVAIKLMTFPKDYTRQLLSIPHLWAQTLILETDKTLLEKTYWLNMNDRSFPFIAVVQHTNMIDKKNYGGRHIAYIGNYLPDNHPYLTLTKEQLLKKFMPHLKKINAKFTILNSFLFTSPFAQPVHTTMYSTRAPKLETPLPHVYLANLDSIYPWDRETNYAVELGQRAAKKILSFDNQ